MLTLECPILVTSRARLHVEGPTRMAVRMDEHPAIIEGKLRRVYTRPVIVQDRARARAPICHADS